VAETSHNHEHAELLSAISRRVREREIQRQLRHNEARKTAIRGRVTVRNYLAEWMPPLAREFVEALLGSLLGFLIIAELLARLAGVSALYTFAVFGVVYAGQSTYYKYKLATDPEFRIPSCHCVGSRADGTGGVLRSRESAVFGIPNSLFAAAFFCTVFVLTVMNDRPAALPLGVIAVAVSAYLSYVMLVRLRSLCTICVNIAALNALILWQLLS
jgi:uncharacterized membrane protein